MKKMTRIAWIVGLTFITASGAFGREHIGSLKKAAAVANKTQAKDCDPGISLIDLDINNIRAKLLNTGDMWWDRSSAKYQVPKISKSALAAGEKGPNTLFSGSIWISGKDGGGNLKIAALTFSGREAEFWPGPLETRNGMPEINKSECKAWDQFFTVYSSEIDIVRGIYKKQGAVASGDIPSNVKYWPALGNPFLQEKGLDAKEYLAPFFDVDNDKLYNPEKGDFPVINPENESYGDQMIFWVLNDVGNVHTSSQGQAIGVQMNCLAFAFASTNELNNMTFYRYHIINKNSEPLLETFMSQFVDCDMGNYNDDYVGCDTVRSLGFVYNSDPFDESVGSLPGYGDQPPLQGIDFFEGPVADKDGKDNDKDGLIDEGYDGIDNDGDGLIDKNDRDEMEQLGMMSFSYFVNGAGGDNTDPTIGIEFRNVQTGFGRTGKRFTVGGNGLGTTGAPTNYCFPGDPSLPSPAWSMCSAGLTAQDLRFVQNSGPFTLASGSEQYITVGAIFVQPPVGSYNGCQINVAGFLGKADDLAQNLFDNQFKVARGPQAPELAIREGNGELIVNIINLPSSNNANEGYKERSPDIPKEAADNTYKFEGYKLYQLISSDVSVGDLNDPTKAKLILQSDIKNGIKDVANEEIIEVNGVKVPIQVVKVKGSDKGLVKTLKLTTDFFESEGNKNLVNNKEYFYGVLAYATNFYEVTKFDTLIKTVKDTSGKNAVYKEVVKTVDIQKFPYKPGQNLAKFSGVPHFVDVNGVTYRAQYNQGIPVSRILGQGNGTFELDLLDSTYSNFFPAGGALNFIDSLTYKGGASPVLVKVVDPKLIKDVDFEVQIKDSVKAPNPLTAKGTWIVIDKTNNDTIFSERDVSRPNDQILISKTGRKYGISLNASFVETRLKNPQTQQSTFSVINATMTYASNFKKWLNLMKDENGAKYKDWIKSGTVQNTNPTTSSEFNAHFFNKAPDYKPEFYDADNHYAKMLDGAIAPYCLAANSLYYSSTNFDASYITYGPAFRWKNPKSNTPQIIVDNASTPRYSYASNAPEYNLEKLQSVDIILTNDRSKWSRCVVMETGELTEQNEGKIFKGQIRAGFSTKMVDLANDNDGIKDGFEEITTDTGRGYFPGYAINVETGERLNIFFGENSRTKGTYAGNMIWDPSETETSKFGEPIFGGMHFIYVCNTRYDEGAAMQRTLIDNQNKFTLGSNDVVQPVRDIYKDILYTAVPLTAPGFDLYKRSSNSKEDNTILNYEIPSDVKIRIRVERPLAAFADNSATARYDSSTLVYSFSTKGYSPLVTNDSITASVLDRINIVPNPYYAYSIYETDQISNVVKITNLPSKADVTIIDLNGVVVRRFSKDIDETKLDVSDGANLEAQDNLGNLDNSIRWDLKNHKGVPIASGIYYIHVSAPGIGERTLKFFGVLRPTDVTSF